MTQASLLRLSSVGSPDNFVVQNSCKASTTLTMKYNGIFVNWLIVNWLIDYYRKWCSPRLLYWGRNCIPCSNALFVWPPLLVLHPGFCWLGLCLCFTWWEWCLCWGWWLWLFKLLWTPEFCNCSLLPLRAMEDSGVIMRNAWNWLEV